MAKSNDTQTATTTAVETSPAAAAAAQQKDPTGAVAALSTETAKMWDSMKDLRTNIYGMTRCLFEICSPLPISESELYLTMKSPATLAAIEETINASLLGKDYNNTVVPAYVVELKDRFCVMSKNPKAV